MTETGTPIRNVDAAPGSRYARTDNKFGLQGMDHFALPSLDIDLMYKFLVEVLGGEPYIVQGYDEVDRERGRAKHVFMRVGDTLFQFATPADGELKVGREDLNAWPHWAFTVTAEAMESNVARLQSLGIPVFGPVTHRGTYGVAAYFTTPEGHKLELKTYDDYPEQLTVGEMGAPGVGFIDWTTLYHDWPNTTKD